MCVYRYIFIYYFLTKTLLFIYFLNNCLIQGTN